MRISRRLGYRLAAALATNTAAICALLLFVAGRAVPLAWALAAVVLLRTVWLARGRRPGGHAAARALVATGFVAEYERAVGLDPVLVVAAVVVLLLTLHEATFRRRRTPRSVAVDLPGYVAPVPSRLTSARVFAVNASLVVLLGIAAATHAPSWPVLVAAALGVAVIGRLAIVTDAARRRGMAANSQANLRQRLEDYSPAFLVYFSGPKGAAYQVKMWLPYLDQLGERYVVLLREAHALRELSGATEAPVVVCSTLAALDNAIVPSLRAVFYVNNGMKNTHCVRFIHLTHVQLLHGDSDKPPSYSPVTAMYDQVFVAGQGGIDRYRKNGVLIPDEKFVIVGRPQVAGIKVATGSIRDVPRPTVLYAPTWKGHYADSDFCSLPISEHLLHALLDRGATVVLRPHPYFRNEPESVRHVARLEQMLAEDSRATGRAHLWGPAASQDVSLFECFDMSDALVGDVSSVVSDYLYSQKPFALTDMLDQGERFADTFPVAEAAYVARRDLGNLDEVLDALLDTDPLAARRRQMRVYYLGDFPSDGYVDAFLSTARRVVSGPVPARVPALVRAGAGDPEPAATDTATEMSASNSVDTDSADTDSADADAQMDTELDADDVAEA